jgi:hypothetical protein
MAGGHHPENRLADAESVARAQYDRGNAARIGDGAEAAEAAEAVEASPVFDDDLTGLGLAKDAMLGGYERIGDDDVVIIGSTDGRGETGETNALSHAAAPIENLDENYSLHDTASMYQLTSASAFW